ncbi:hypothetical protein JCM15519_24530 [Fundidesulfovibrio butyratiphilus]
MLPGVTRWASLALVVSLTVAMTLLGDWLVPSSGAARGFGAASGPRGSVAYTPRGSVAVGARGGAAVRAPGGAAAVRAPGGAAAVRMPGGAAAARMPGGAAAARGPGGGVVAAPRGRVVPPPPPPGYRRPPVVVPVPVAPGYYGPPPVSGVAAGVALGAMLTVLPATAIAIANSSGHTVYRVESKCYREVIKNGSTVYEAIPCP